MADKSETGLIGELTSQAAEAHALILEAARLCVESGCSTAKFEPDKIAGAVAAGRLSLEGATAIAGKFTACQGLTEDVVTLCHLGDESQQVTSPVFSTETGI